MVDIIIGTVFTIWVILAVAMIFCVLILNDIVNGVYEKEDEKGD